MPFSGCPPVTGICPSVDISSLSPSTVGMSTVASYVLQWVCLHCPPLQWVYMLCHNSLSPPPPPSLPPSHPAMRYISCNALWVCPAMLCGYALQCSMDMSCNALWVCPAMLYGYVLQCSVGMPCNALWVCPSMLCAVGMVCPSMLCGYVLPCSVGMSFHALWVCPAMLCGYVLQFSVGMSAMLCGYVLPCSVGMSCNALWICPAMLFGYVLQFSVGMALWVFPMLVYPPLLGYVLLHWATLCSLPHTLL